MKKIAVLSPYSHNGAISGAKVRAQQVVLELKSRGDTVHLYSPWNEADYYFSLDAPLVVRVLKVLWLSIFLNLRRYDVVISESPIPPLNLCRFRYLHVIHDTKFCTEFARSRGRIAFLAHKISASLADNVVAVSETEAKKISCLFRLDIRKIIVIYNGVSSRFLKERCSVRAQAKMIDFLYVSNFASHKGHIDFLRACNPSFKIAFVGSDFGELARIKAFIADHALDVDFFSSLSTDDLISVYDRSRCFVFPSQLEGFGMPMVEAYARNVPVIANSIAVFRELSYYTGATLFDFGDTEGLSLLLLDFLCGRVHLQEGRVPPEFFSWKSIIERTGL